MSRSVWSDSNRAGYEAGETPCAGKRPRNRPRGAALCQFGNTAHRWLMKRCILAVHVDRYVGVEGNHPPRPLYARSRILSQSASRNSGTNPCPLNVTLRSRNGRAAFRSAMILRSPCSTSARRAVRSRTAIFRASRKSGSDISSVVLTFHIHGFANMGSNITYAHPYGHFTIGGIDDKIASTLPPVLSPNTVPRS